MSICLAASSRVAAGLSNKPDGGQRDVRLTKREARGLGEQEYVRAAPGHGAGFWTACVPLFVQVVPAPSTLKAGAAAAPFRLLHVVPALFPSAIIFGCSKPVLSLCSALVSSYAVDKKFALG